MSGAPARTPLGRLRQDPVWRLLALARPVRARLLLAVLAATGTAAAAVGLTATAAWMLATAAGQPPVLTLAVAVVVVRACGLGRGVLRYVERLTGHDAAFRVLAQTRSQVWQRLEPLVPGGLGRTRTGDLLSRLVADVDALQDLYLRALAPPLVALVVGAGCVVLSTALLPAAGLLLAAALLAAAVGLPAVALLADRGAASRRAPARGRLTAAVVDALDGAAELAATGAAPVALERLAQADRELLDADRAGARSTGAADALQALLTGAAVVGALLLGLPAVDDGRVSGVALAVLVLTALAAGEVTAGLPDAARALAASRAAAVRVFAVLDAPAPVADPAHPLPVPPGPYDLVVQDLVVRHPGAAVPALDGVDLRLPAGHRVAVVGASGSGKSTLVDVLLRFREAASGRVLLAGVDTTRLAADDVRTVVGGCLQSTHVFATSLRENVRLGRPGADDAALDAVAERVGLREWVAGLPDGWDTPAGEAGALLSGGQAHRISLARALLADRPVMLLDEPTVGLDRALADAVTADLLDATAGRTLLLVTHRLAGLEQVDEVVVLDAGRVVQRGTHDALLRQEGAYLSLWRAERAADRLGEGLVGV